MEQVEDFVRDNPRDMAFLMRRRRATGLLSLMTAAIFIGFLLLITLSPGSLVREQLVYAGFAIIGFSIAVTFFYQLWIDRGQDGLSSKGGE